MPKSSPIKGAAKKQLLELIGMTTLPTISQMVMPIEHLDITPGRKRVLAVYIQPWANLITITLKSKIAQVTQRYWHMCMAEQDFLDLAIKESINLLAKAIPAATHAYIQVGLAGNANVLEKILTSGGVLNPDSNIILTAEALELLRKEKLAEGMKQFGVKQIENGVDAEFEVLEEE